MANKAENLYKPTPAKRAKLEISATPGQSDGVFGNRKDQSVRPAKKIEDSNENFVPSKDIGRGVGLALGMLGDPECGPRHHHHHHQADDVDLTLIKRSELLDGVVNSNSDSLGDYYNGGDSGFNELTPTTSPDYLDLLPEDGVGSFPEELDDLGDDPIGEELGNSTAERLNDDKINEDEAAGDDADEVASTISNLSGLSDLSDMSGQEWKAVAGPSGWIQRQMQLGTSPRELLRELVPSGTHIPPQLDNTTLWKIVVNMLSEPPCREKLQHVNTLDDVVGLIRNSSKIIVLTGAGVSVSCGIPDFRSRDGIYTRLAKDFPDLPDPQAMFDINYFRKDPRPFFKFAREIYPGQFKPSLSHKFIKLLEDRGKLLRNYSQNIDTLEQIAKIERVIQCHGSFATASCMNCGHKVDADAIQEEVFAQRIPQCPKCPPSPEQMAVLKPDIVFFGEGLSDEFHSTMAQDKDCADLLIVIGSSLKVRPVALIPNSIPGNVPQILINREPLNHLNFDVELLGDCDGIINEICWRLGWNEVCFAESLKEIKELPPRPIDDDDDDDSADSNGSHVPSKTCKTKPTGHAISDAILAASNPKGDAKDEGTAKSPDRLTPDTASDSAGQNKTKDGSDAKDPVSEHDLEALRNCWKPRLRLNMAERLPAGTYLFERPSRYVFSGAEVFYDPEEEKWPGEHRLRQLSRRCDNESSSDSDSNSSGDLNLDEFGEMDPVDTGSTSDGETSSSSSSHASDVSEKKQSSSSEASGGEINNANSQNTVTRQFPEKRPRPPLDEAIVLPSDNHQQVEFS